MSQLYSYDEINDLVANTVHRYASQGYLIDEDSSWFIPSSFRVRLAKRHYDSIYETIISTTEKNDFIIFLVSVLLDNKEIYTSTRSFMKDGDSDMYILLQDKNSIFDEKDINNRSLDDYINVTNNADLNKFSDSAIKNAAIATSKINEIISRLANRA